MVEVHSTWRKLKTTIDTRMIFHGHDVRLNIIPSDAIRLHTHRLLAGSTSRNTVLQVSQEKFSGTEKLTARGAFDGSIGQKLMESLILNTPHRKLVLTAFTRRVKILPTLLCRIARCRLQQPAFRTNFLIGQRRYPMIRFFRRDGLCSDAQSSTLRSRIVKDRTGRGRPSRSARAACPGRPRCRPPRRSRRRA